MNKMTLVKIGLTIIVVGGLVIWTLNSIYWGWNPHP